SSPRTGVISSRNPRFGLEGTPNPTQFPPAMAGTPFPVPGAPAPVSSLALGTARDPGAAPAALGIPAQHPPHPPRFELDIEKELFPVRVGRGWAGIPRAAGAAPESLAGPKARLDTGAGSTWDRGRCPCHGRGCSSSPSSSFFSMGL
ncbi:unnamed protein product, partial [Coccothraustes coccothraustes]